MDRLQLDDAEVRAVIDLADRLAIDYDRVDDQELLVEIPIAARELPVRVHRFLHRLRREEFGCGIIGGLPIDDAAIGPTPGHWQQARHPSPTLRYELLLLLYTSLIGEVFGWGTQQDGRLVHDVLPIKAHRMEQLGTGSETLLTWHTEDAFHPYRADYVVLACLRNPYRAATQVGGVDDLTLAERDLELLRDERYVILPDESHRPQNNSGNDGIDFSDIEAMLANPPAVAVLFGDRKDPYVRADPYFMRTAEGDELAESALRNLVTEMDARMADVVLEPGDYCFLDNFKVVHGRRPFMARFDGTDRWLKRVCVARDLRKSRAARKSATSPVVG